MKKQGNRGITLIEYAVSIPIIAIVSIALIVFSRYVIESNRDINKAVNFEQEQIILDTSILKALAKGQNNVSIINGDKSQGFEVNGTVYKFSTKTPVDYEALKVSVDIIENKLIVNTQQGATIYKREYNIKYWGSDYE